MDRIQLVWTSTIPTCASCRIWPAFATTLEASNLTGYQIGSANAGYQCKNFAKMLLNIIDNYKHYKQSQIWVFPSMQGSE